MDIVSGARTNPIEGSYWTRSNMLVSICAGDSRIQSNSPPICSFSHINTATRTVYITTIQMWQGRSLLICQDISIRIVRMGAVVGVERPANSSINEERHSITVLGLKSFFSL